MLLKVLGSCNVSCTCAGMCGVLGETSKLKMAGCSQSAAAFRCCVWLFLYKLAATGC